MGLLSAMTVITKTKVPEAKHVKNGIFLKYHLLLPRKYPSSFIMPCNIRYDDTLISALILMSNLQMYDSLLH